MEEVEAHFRTLSPSDPEFDHFTPAAYLLDNKSAVLKAFPEETLNRFEALFKDLNKFIPSSSAPSVAIGAVEPSTAAV